MQKAAFSIEKYVFNKVNLDLDQHDLESKDISLSFNTSGIYYSEISKYELIFSVTAFDEQKSLEQPFLQVECKGQFVFQEVNSFEEIPDFFYRNSIAIIFPYLRAYISIITTQANTSGIILPTLNLSSLEHDLKRNSVQSN